MLVDRFTVAQVSRPIDERTLRVIRDRESGRSSLPGGLGVCPHVQPAQQS